LVNALKSNSVTVPLNKNEHDDTLIAFTPPKKTTLHKTIPKTILINGKSRKFEASIIGAEASYLIYIDATTAWSVTATKSNKKLEPSDWAKNSYVYKELERQIQHAEGKHQSNSDFMTDLSKKWQKQYPRSNNSTGEQVKPQNASRIKPAKANWLQQAWLGYSENAARAYVGVREFLGADAKWVAKTNNNIARNLHYKGADVSSPTFGVGKAINNIGIGALIAEGAIALAPESALLSVGGFLMRPAIKAGAPVAAALQTISGFKSGNAEQATYGMASLPISGALLFKNIRSMGELIALMAGRNAAAKNLHILEQIKTSEGQLLLKLAHMVKKMPAAEQVSLDKTLKQALIERFERADAQKLKDVQSALSKLNGVETGAVKDTVIVRKPAQNSTPAPIQITVYAPADPIIIKTGKRELATNSKGQHYASQLAPGEEQFIGTTQRNNTFENWNALSQSQKIDLLKTTPDSKGLSTKSSMFIANSTNVTKQDLANIAALLRRRPQQNQFEIIEEYLKHTRRSAHFKSLSPAEQLLNLEFARGFYENHRTGMSIDEFKEYSRQLYGARDKYFTTVELATPHFKEHPAVLDIYEYSKKHYIHPDEAARQLKIMYEQTEKIKQRTGDAGSINWKSEQPIDQIHSEIQFRLRKYNAINEQFNTFNKEQQKLIENWGASFSEAKAITLEPEKLQDYIHRIDAKFASSDLYANGETPDFTKYQVLKDVISWSSISSRHTLETSFNDFIRFNSASIAEECGLNTSQSKILKEAFFKFSLLERDGITTTLRLFKKHPYFIKKVFDIVKNQHMQFDHALHKMIPNFLPIFIKEIKLGEQDSATLIKVTKGEILRDYIHCIEIGLERGEGLANLKTALALVREHDVSIRSAVAYIMQLKKMPNVARTLGLNAKQTQTALNARREEMLGKSLDKRKFISIESEMSYAIGKQEEIKILKYALDRTEATKKPFYECYDLAVRSSAFLEGAYKLKLAKADESKLIESGISNPEQVQNDILKYMRLNIGSVEYARSTVLIANNRHIDLRIAYNIIQQCNPLQLAIRLRLDKRDTQLLKRLIKASDVDLALQISKFLLNLYQKHYPDPDSKLIVTQFLKMDTADALSELELVSAGAHNMKALKVFLDKQEELDAQERLKQVK
jgi:hypothetical protein